MVQDQFFIQPGFFLFQTQGKLFLIISLFQLPRQPTDSLHITSSSTEQTEYTLTHMQHMRLYAKSSFGTNTFSLMT